MNTVTIKRLNGDEIYKINKVLLKFHEEDNIKYLKIRLSTDSATQTLEDTKSIKALPPAEINLNINSFDKNVLQSAKFSLSESYDKNAQAHQSTLYYVEHQDLDNNEVAIKLIDNGFYDIKWSATTPDVCYYAGSKPNNTVIIETEGSFLEN